MSINETGVVARPEELIKLDKLFAEGVDFVDRHLREVQVSNL